MEMKNQLDIRLIYKPVQPAVKQSASGVTYLEFLPDIRLQKFIYCYWQLRTVQKLAEPFNYRIVADGCIDIFFELNNPQENYVMGFCTQKRADGMFSGSGPDHPPNERLVPARTA